jgi:GNAT superfamily N-acetyltransferase
MILVPGRADGATPMSLRWIHESPPEWDEVKAAILGAAPPGALSLGDHETGDLLPGEWWRVEDEGSVVGYGWMDCTWGDAEILLAVDSASQGRGVGSFILDKLEVEAAQRGLNYLYNVVPARHPDRDGLARWLRARRFEPSHDDERLMRRVHPEQQRR